MFKNILAVTIVVWIFTWSIQGVAHEEQSRPINQPMAPHRFDIRLVNPRFATLKKSVPIEKRVGTINIIVGNSFGIDLKNGTIGVEAESFEKVINGQTYGADFRIRPAPITMDLNCCYNTMFVYELVLRDGEYQDEYKTVYARVDGKDSWEVVSPREKIR